MRRSSLALIVWGIVVAGCARDAGNHLVRDTEQFTEPAIDLVFKRIPAGEFEMGSHIAQTMPEEERRWFIDEAPVRKVSISKPFWLATTETTIHAFKVFVEETGYRTTAERTGSSLGKYTVTPDAAGKLTGQWGPAPGLNWRNPGWTATDKHPVTHVSWEDVVSFLTWLRAKTGKNYRLPTEAEWEYAAGGPAHSTYSWGNDVPSSGREGNIADKSFAAQYPQWKYPVLITVDDKYVHTAPVASYLPNGYSLYDMTGNVWEWCADYYEERAYDAGRAVDPAGPASGELRVHRGGGFDWELSYLRVAKRRKGSEQMTAPNIGFRLAL